MDRPRRIQTVKEAASSSDPSEEDSSSRGKERSAHLLSTFEKGGKERTPSIREGRRSYFCVWGGGREGRY